MQWLWESMKQAYAFLAIVPIIPFAIVYYGYGALIRDRKRALRTAMDVTTLMLIGCVAVLFNRLFSNSFGLYGILLLMLIGGGLLGNLQFRSKGEVDVKRVVRAVWRIGFFIMSVLYVLLMFVGLSRTLFAV
ncbi:DUF3397 domain-containing protein [Paenibacillus beijingensis]|nr:DUF3397 domain-containing protein [Paenibacillus beijingensis]